MCWLAEGVCWWCLSLWQLEAARREYTGIEIDLGCTEAAPYYHRRREEKPSGSKINNEYSVEGKH